MLAAKNKQPAPDDQMPQASTFLTLPDAVSTVNDFPPAENPPPTHIQPLPATTARKPSYRQLPTKVASSIPVEGPKKRKYGSKESRTIRYFEDLETDGDGTDDNSGDGSSSGGSISSNAPALSKRQRTSRIITRASTRILVPGTHMEGVPDSASPALAVTACPSLATPDVDSDTPDHVASVDPSASTMDVDGSSDRGVPSETEVFCGTDSEDLIITDTEDLVITDTEDPVTDTQGATVTDTEDPTTDTEDPTINGTEVTSAADAEVSVTDTEVATATLTKIIGITPTTNPTATLHPPTLASLNDIDKAGVPAFLLRHGKGKREVNIFGYLDEVTDAHFRQVLFQYLRFEINDRSGAAGSLPTKGRPVEISQWTARARPAGIPDFTKGGRTFTDFVDSVLRWWSSIRPSWRTFERSKPSREVRGGWDVLHAPRINGLLNVVMLVYWWASILEEHKPEDGVREDYEFFADDVAWVLSNLTT